MVSVRPGSSGPVPTKQGASSAAISPARTVCPLSAASATEAGSPDPTRGTSQPCANAWIAFRVYSRLTVPLAPGAETRLVVDDAQAGLIAGTAPTKGNV